MIDMVTCQNCVRLESEVAATRAIVERIEKAAMENAVTLAATRTVVEEMQKTLLGNGQPGWCAEHRARIARLESWRSWITGALAVLGMLWAAGVTVFVAWARKG